MKKVNLNKDVFTTFEVAKICNADVASIQKWIKDGKLSAFRTPGGHRRIERNNLISFLKHYGMPNPFTARDRKRVLIIGKDPATVELIRRSIGRQHEAEGTDDPLEAHLLIGERSPDVLVVDLMMEGLQGLHLLKLIRSNPNLKNMRIIAHMDTEDIDLEHQVLESGEVNHFVRHQDGLEKLTATLTTALV